MSQYRIISPNKHGGIKITIPSDRWLERNNYNFKLLAQKLGCKDYKVVNIKDLPQSRGYRLSWKYPVSGVKVEECTECYKSALKGFKFDLVRKCKGDKKSALKRLESLSEGIDNINNLEELKAIELALKDNV